MPVLTCHICGQVFARGCGLASHIRSHQTTKLQCDSCDYVTDDKAAFKQHRRNCEVFDDDSDDDSKKAAKYSKPEPKRFKPSPPSPVPAESHAAATEETEPLVLEKPAKRAYRKRSDAILPDDNENLAPPSRKVSFAVPELPQKAKAGRKSDLTKEQLSDLVNKRIDAWDKKKGKKDLTKEDSDYDGVVERVADLKFFPLPIGSKFAQPGDETDYQPRFMEVGRDVPILKKSGSTEEDCVDAILVSGRHPIETSEESSEPSTSESSREASTEPLREPKLEDFFIIPDAKFGETRHYVEANEMYVTAMAEYTRQIKKPTTSLSMMGIKEYLRIEREIDASRQCPDCPYKKANLKKFRAHRDRHELGGSYKCKECNYRSHLQHSVEDHMFVDHYLSDVKVLEGYPSSDSDDEEEPVRYPTPEPVEEPKTKKRGRKRRHNW